MDYLLQIFKALSNERRLKILELLIKKDELSLSEIASILKIPEATCCRNLKILEKVYLVKSKIRKGEAYYKLNKPKNHPYNEPLFKLIEFRQKRKLR